MAQTPLSDFSRWLPPEGIKIVVVLFLSFLVGLEREEHKSSTRYSFGGVRTFPLIGLIGYAVALLSKGELLPIAIGLAVVGAFLLMSYHQKLCSSAASGVTSEMAGLMTYLVGVLVYKEEFWIATTLSVASMFLLEMKGFLENLSIRIAPEEILTFTKFLLLSAVILPVLPNTPLGPFEINPFKTWLVVVAVSGVSYASYVIGRLTKEKSGILLAAVLGGAYSSTVTTVALARRAKNEDQPHLFSGCTLIACGIMYLRLAALLGIFNRGLADKLAVPFIILAGGAAVFGWVWSRIPDPVSKELKREYTPRNPLEMRAALIFAGLFLAMLVATHAVAVHLGSAGVYGLAGVMGLADVDPFIMGMTQSAGTVTTLSVAAWAVAIAASSNNVAKGCYAFSIAGGRTGRMSLLLLLGLSIIGLAPLLWL